MKTIFCDNSYVEKWDEFVKNNALDFGLLQSWRWGEFQESLGRKIFRLAAVDEKENISAAAQIIKMPLRFGKSYFYVPRGPIISQKSSQWLPLGEVKSQKLELEIFELLFFEIKKLAKKENAIFLRFDPALRPPLNPPLIKGGRNIFGEGFRNVGQVQPKQTLVLDLTKSEAELLAQMKSKTRYNIKVAEKHGVEILDHPPAPSFKQGGGEISYFNDFWRLMEKTASRQEIKPHPKEYYQKMLAVLGERGIIKLFVAKYQEKVIAANLVAFFGDWAVYLHGASDYDFRDKMAPYLLQWETIKEAKKQGKRFYDFWGVDEAKWPGITRFKIGFAPEQKFTEYVGAFDAVFNKFWYAAHKLFKKF